MKSHLQSTTAPHTPAPAGDDHDAYSVRTFCDRHDISRAYFYLLMKRGTAPRIIKLGARTLITREAAADWRRQMEVSAAQAA